MAYVLTVKEIGEDEWRDMEKPQFLFDTEAEVARVEEQYQKHSIAYDRGLLYSHREVNG